jgi:hypothetical protein
MRGIYHSAHNECVQRMRFQQATSALRKGWVHDNVKIMMSKFGVVALNWSLDLVESR